MISRASSWSPCFFYFCLKELDRLLIEWKNRILPALWHNETRLHLHNFVIELFPIILDRKKISIENFSYSYELFSSGSICLFVYLFVCVFVCLYVCSFVCLYVCLYYCTYLIPNWLLSWAPLFDSLLLSSSCLSVAFEEFCASCLGVDLSSFCSAGYSLRPVLWYALDFCWVCDTPDPFMTLMILCCTAI